LGFGKQCQVWALENSTKFKAWPLSKVPSLKLGLGVAKFKAWAWSKVPSLNLGL